MTTYYRTDQIAGSLLRGDGTVATVVGRRLPTQGYAMGLPKYTLSSVAPFSSDVADLLSWVDANKTRTGWLGAWKDTNTGTVYFDVVAIVPERAHAERLGRDRGEIAIWDIAAGEEIRL